MIQRMELQQKRQGYGTKRPSPVCPVHRSILCVNLIEPLITSLLERTNKLSWSMKNILFVLYLHILTQDDRNSIYLEKSSRKAVSGLPAPNPFRRSGHSSTGVTVPLHLRIPHHMQPCWPMPFLFAVPRRLRVLPLKLSALPVDRSQSLLVVKAQITPPESAEGFDSLEGQ